MALGCWLGDGDNETSDGSGAAGEQSQRLSSNPVAMLHRRLDN